MILVERKDLDENQWSNWCKENSDNGPFCQLEYLDALSENTLFLIDENKGGIALPYKTNLGVKTLYTPVFCRWIAFIGEQQLTGETITNTVSQHLTQADVYVKDELFHSKKESLVYQTVNKEQYSLNTQAKRKIKKAEKEAWEIVWNPSFKDAIDLIEASLKNKFKTLEDSSFPLLRKLAENFEKTKQLKVVALLNEEKVIVGSLILISAGSKLLYLKGACEESVKQKGGMYLLMNESIQHAFAQNQSFDFGGSRIPGVRKFNLSFGGVDQHYYHYQWSKGPFWFTLLKRWRNSLKKS